METRSTSTHVSFRKPFTLRGVDGIQPAGRYVVHSEEGMLDTVTYSGWRQTALAIEIARDGATEHVAIDSQDLREALLRDGGQSTDPPAAPPSRARRARDLMRRGGRS